MSSPLEQNRGGKGKTSAKLSNCDERGEGWQHLSSPNYGVATISELLKIMGLFCKRALQKRPIFSKETYDFKERTNRRHPVTDTFTQLTHLLASSLQSNTSLHQSNAFLQPIHTFLHQIHTFFTQFTHVFTKLMQFFLPNSHISAPN